MFDDLVKTLAAFLLGLATKVLYDLWVERRKRRALTLKKRFDASFSSHALAEPIRKAATISYDGHPVTSIKLASLEVKNVGSQTLRNQAVTIRFEEGAAILGEPTSEGSSEDLRFVEFERRQEPNTQRILISLLRRGHSIRWRLPVIDHRDDTFQVEHGLALADPSLTEADLDVDVAILTAGDERALPRQFAHLIGVAVLPQVVVLSMIVGYLSFGLRGLQLSVVASAFICVVAIASLRRSLAPVINWLDSRREPSSQVTMNVDIRDLDSPGSVVITAHDAHVSTGAD